MIHTVLRGVLRASFLGSLALGLGCNSLAGIREGKPYPDACKTAADCNQGDVGCRVASCTNERCVYDDTPDGIPLPATMQTIGDCLEAQCDGLGHQKFIPVPADIPDDNEPCTEDECVGSTPTHRNRVSIPCYTGPVESIGVGNCRGGTMKCDNGHATGICTGERVPIPETCLTIFDDDCDGSVNEEGLGCICIPGTLGNCFPGQQEQLANLPCAIGTQPCNALGTAYDACSGYTPPTPETCDLEQKDEDCDGFVNEEGSDCVCGDGFTSNQETCDDGNAIESDGCTNACRIPGCGDGVVDPSDECDDGNHDNGDDCTNQCKHAVCGDGFVWFGQEECDDGNVEPGDSCDAKCALEKVQYACLPWPCQTVDDCMAPTDECVMATCSEGQCGCELRNGTECRASAGACDVVESCNGLSTHCPVDILASGVECRVSTGLCDPAEVCDGMQADCPADLLASAGTECRAAIDQCDAAESCDGVSFDCPVDTFVPANTLCRPSAGVCDVTERCDGTMAACPTDQLVAANVPCQTVTGLCSSGEVCDGANAGCAPDPNASVVCGVMVPFTFNLYERKFTITTVNVNGTGTSLAVVPPGANVTFGIVGSWSLFPNSSCPGCVTQFYTRMNGVFSLCFDVTPTMGTLNNSTSFTAPMTPGTYYINPLGSWLFDCSTMTNVSPNLGPTTLGVLIVN